MTADFIFVPRLSFSSDYGWGTSIELRIDYYRESRFHIDRGRPYFPPRAVEECPVYLRMNFHRW